MAKYKLNINGTTRTVTADPDTPLLWVLRETLGLVGTKYGCGVGLCGACTVHLDGVPAQACATTVSAIGRQRVTTIEGLDAKGQHPLQLAWQELDVPQCGYCQPAQIMTAAALLKQNPDPRDEDIDRAMAGVLCRCGTYVRIREGVHRAARLANERKAGK